MIVRLARKKIKLVLLLLIPTLMPIFLIGFIFIAVLGSGSGGGTSSLGTNGQVKYALHWSDGDAYTHNLLVHRYGITAEQIDGFLGTLGVNYDKNRINGAKLLEWESKSNLDVRAILSIAMNESSLGTAGVATNAGSNMFGYGAFDSNPENANNFNDEVAVVALTKQTIIANHNETFKIQDEKAQKNANGSLSPSDGGVYFTDTSGSGKRRAELMEKMDKYIDEHGGTPEPPASSNDKPTSNLASGSLASSWEFPSEYADKMKYGQPTSASLTTLGANSYPVGQCTWYVANRLQETGISQDAGIYNGNGNGQDWVRSLVSKGWKESSTPVEGAVVSTAGGYDSTYPQYGHVGFVEHVNEDGTFLVSELNYSNVQDKVHYRVCQQASYYSFAVKE